MHIYGVIRAYAGGEKLIDVSRSVVCEASIDIILRERGWVSIL